MEITLTNRNFKEEVLESDLPVLVDFWATWCGPCRMVAPSVAQIAEEYAGRVKVGKVNVDEEPALAGHFGIDSIPTFLLFKNGQMVQYTMGAQPKQNLESLVESVL